MLNFYSVPDGKLTLAARTLKRELEARGWLAETPHAQSSLYFLTRPDGKKFRIFSSTPHTTSFAAAHLANDKFATYELLKSAGIPQPDTILIDPSSNPTEFIKKHKKTIFKPLYGGHGRGITANITSVDQLPDAFKEAERYAYGDRQQAVLQRQLDIESLKDLRILCIGYKFIITDHRIPARVTGDGTHTVSELIDIENSTFRGEPYITPFARINKANALKYLGPKAADIPAEGKKVSVLATANLGQGGELIDYTAETSEALRELSEKIARLTELPVIGIDFLGDDVIEVNKCPSLCYYKPGTTDINPLPTIKYIEYLETL